MVKPFSPKELEARIRCVMRRVSSVQASGVAGPGRTAHVVVVGDLSIDFNKRQAAVMTGSRAGMGSTSMNC